MDSQIVVGLISLAGAAIGTFGGILVSNRLTVYRVSQVEKKMDKHNCMLERVYRLEEGQAVLCEQIKGANHRLDDLEKE
jgi:hypothetical protein